MSDREPQPQPDSTANSGQEQRITSITFRELSMQIYRERVREPEKPKDMQWFFAGTREVYQGPFVPTIGFYCEPAWVDRNRTRINLLGVNSLYSSRIGEHSIKGGMAENVRPFTVYDFEVDKIADPTVLDDLKEVYAEEILVAANAADARVIGSWVASQDTRNRINDWSRITFNKDENPREFSRRKSEIDKYVMLRQAPYNTSNVPGFSTYTYQGVVEAATRQFNRVWDPSAGKRVDEPVTYRAFTEEDVKWLETFMRNKGLPIPQCETS